MSAPTTVRLAPDRITAARPRHLAGVRTEVGPPGTRVRVDTSTATPHPPASVAPDVDDGDDGITEHLRCPLRTDPLARTTAPPTGERPGVGLAVEPDMASAMVALAAVEVLGGDRQQAQLARWLLPEVYDTLSRRAALTTHHAALVRSARRDGPSNAFPPSLGGHLLDATAPTTVAAGRDEMVGGLIRAHGTRPVVRRLRMCRIDEDTVESSVVVVHARRVRAVAVRLVRLRGRWRASALVIG